MKLRHLRYENTLRQQGCRDLQMESVLVDRSGKIIAAGKLGKTHQRIFRRALNGARNDVQCIQLIDALSNDAPHRFEVPGLNGKPIFGQTGNR